MPFKTLYNWLDKGWLDIKREVLPDHGVRYRKSHDGRGQYTRGAKFINQRPDEANLRQEIGHFEVDTILSGKTRGEVLATTKAILKLNEELRGLIKSITSDHGKEFAGFKEIEACEIAHYFAHPYAPHERGTNERLNRELRLHIPKNQSIESVTDEELTMISKYLNWRPRKCLGWKTPLQVFFGDLSEKFD
uniref:IS30 family transposase n=1 Tax=Limosilactobacillus fermentum TaxID=1613 RepID=UPI00301CC9C1